MNFNIWLVLVLGIFSYFILPFILWLIKNNKARNILTGIFFGLYLIVLFAGVFGKIGISAQNVSISFDFSGRWCAKNINASLDLNGITKFDLIINLVMLIPVGMFVIYFGRKRKWWLKIILLIVFGALSGIFIELLQFILPVYRSVQLTDILLNTISVFVGGLIAWGYLAVIKKIRTKKY